MSGEGGDFVNGVLQNKGAPAPLLLHEDTVRGPPSVNRIPNLQPQEHGEEMSVVCKPPCFIGRLEWTKIKEAEQRKVET